MRRLPWLLVAATLLLGCTGCAGAQESTRDGIPVLFYYVTRDSEQMEADETVAAETRYPGVASLLEVIELYLRGPESEDLVSPFPTGTQVLDLSSDGERLTLQLSGEFFTLTGVELTVASCCLANTLCAYAELESVILTDETESIHMEVQPDQFLLSNSLQTASDTSYTLYFADSEQRYLIAETREVTLSENDTDMAYVMRELLGGSESDQLLPVLPEGTSVLELAVSDGVCTVDFSSEFYTSAEDIYSAYMTIYGVANTLTSLDEINAVQFLVEGETVESYGPFPLDEPVLRNTACIGPVRTASGEVDVNIYVLSDDGETYFAVPCCVKQTVSEPLAQAVVTQILAYEPPNGFYNPVPYGTELLSISVSGGVCYVDVSERFVPQEGTQEAEEAAVWALVQSLTDLDGISSVVLSIEGESSGLRYVDISEPLMATSFFAD